MTLSQLRRRVNALKRRFAPELTIIRLRRISEAVADDWDPGQPPDPADVIERFVPCRLPPPHLRQPPPLPGQCPTPGGRPSP